MTSIELAGRRPALRRQLERCKLKTGCHGASHQRPVAACIGGLPRPRRHDRLRHFAGGEIGTKPDAAAAPVIGHLQAKRAACVIMPDLHRIDAMPVRALAARQQEIDRGRERPAVGVRARVAKSLAKCPPSGCGCNLSRAMMSAAEGTSTIRDLPSGFVLAFAQLAEHLDGAPALHPHAGRDRRLVGPQEHIGFLLCAEQRRNRRLVGRAQPRHFLGARL
jgi:hypothetical protein